MNLWKHIRRPSGTLFMMLIPASMGSIGAELKAADANNSDLNSNKVVEAEPGQGLLLASLSSSVQSVFETESDPVIQQIKAAPASQAGFTIKPVSLIVQEVKTVDVTSPVSVPAEAKSVSTEAHSSTQEKQPLFIASNEVPAGFENFDTPQQSLIDIYYGNRYLTSQLATFQGDNVTFANPAEVVRLIGSISDPEFMKSALTGELNSNAEAICQEGQTEGCGVINPPVAGVIFDENTFRADVFINPRFLLTRAADVRKYLPPSDAGFALLQNASAVVSGSTQEDSKNDYTLNGLTLLSYKENSLYWSWDYSKSQHFSVNQLYAQREFEGIEYNAGLLSSRSFGLNFTSDQTLLGARLETSDNTRNDTDFSRGMPVEVFMPLRGRIEVHKDGRLIASFFHEAGLQELDTSGFPSGAYDIEIRILDEQGNEQSRTEQFFAKQYQLPPIGEWRYFAEAGQILNRTSENAFAEKTDQWLARAGVSRRLSDTTAGTLAVAANKDSSLAELGIYNLGYRYELSPSLMLADDGQYGMQVNARTWVGDISLNGNYRRLWEKEVQDVVENRPALLGGAFEQAGFSVATPFMDGSLNYRFSSSRTGDSDPTKSHSINYRRNLFRTTKSNTSLQISLSESEGNKVALFSVEWSMRNDRWNFRASPQVELQNNNGVRNSRESARLNASWEDGELYAGRLRGSLGASFSEGQRNLSSSAQYANHLGRASLNVNHNSSDSGNNVTSYSGSFSTSFLTDGDVVAVGGEQSAESAVVVNVDGRDGDVFDVKINGSRRGYAVAGQASVIPLSPFEQYTITLTPSGNSFYSFDESQRNFTLYPGNVVTLDYEAIALQLLFGRLLFNGEPLDGARITGGLYSASTDDIGLFQLEARTDVDTLQVELNNGWLCSLDIPEASEKNVLRMGSIELADASCAPQLEGQLAISKRK
ncbi:hypothetical protein EOPP23_06120 [Endozoicomonas sp. OPT23]|uniref:TcfC E-set like domain-containing protein n=1 Tax=Endozoicomonas sp. OPT23 TaxID=2072845 RepID=UPI00129A3051|nr:TcfC E-set like domain-containing protein [Endozoicomonas sp. OPT23]MRI32561.1 hypothetical protein [Endozoicomonas sp. OPT23]